jgi:hypothetical protein
MRCTSLSQTCSRRRDENRGPMRISMHKASAMRRTELSDNPQFNHLTIQKFCPNNRSHCWSPAARCWASCVQTVQTSMLKPAVPHASCIQVQDREGASPQLAFLRVNAEAPRGVKPTSKLTFMPCRTLSPSEFEARQKNAGYPSASIKASSVRLNREQVQLVNLHRAIFARVDRAKGLLQRKFLEHRHRENL